MRSIKKYIGDLYLTTRFYLALGLCIVLFIVSFFVPDMFTAVKIILLVITALIFIDYLFLFVFGKAPSAKRLAADRFSNGDENKVAIYITNNHYFKLWVEVIDEVPVQFQIHSNRMSR